MNRGYFKTWRKIIDSAVFQSEGLLKVFVWCMARAAYKTTFILVRTGRGTTEVRLVPGSFIFGRDSAGRELNMPPSTVWKRILKLKKLEILNIESNSHYSIIYIINWHIYQSDQEKRNSESDRQGTGKEHKEEYKELKNKKYSENSQSILAYLNAKTGKRFRDASQIEARLKDDATVDECKSIINLKLKDPFFISNPRYLNPKTLFCKSHWDNYLNETISEESPESAAPGSFPLASVFCPRCQARVIRDDLIGAGCYMCGGAA